MIKNVAKQPKESKEDMLKRFEQIEYHKDVDIDRFVDVQMNEKIKGQLKDLDDQIEVLGKVCDKQYQTSYNLLKSILDKESEKIDNNIKNYIASLREHLLNFKNRLNFDYKGKFKQVSNKVNALVDQTKKNVILKQNLENKQQVLNEDNEFYERQIDNMKDMNIYLRYKLKLLLKDFSKNNTTNNINENMQNTDMKLEEENEEQKNKTQQVELPKYDNHSDLLITELNEPMNINENIEKKFTEEQINKINQRLNYMTQKLYYEIENEKIEYSNLKEVFNKLYVKTNNIYFNILKNTYYEQKANNNNPSGNNSSSISNNNQSTLPSIYQSTSSSRKNQSTTEDGSRYIRKGEGFMDKMKNKEIIIKFLENESIKKIIYKMLYED